MILENVLLFLGDLGGGEIMIILVVFLLLFGAKRIPELARGLGRGIREFKDAASEVTHEITRAADEQDRIKGEQQENQPSQR
ncbi:Sec-independent protein translocase subunit TatA/TatB [Pontibacter liquoris]|uniref:Sec-independent protein translocase subunit TatA/TatB n=1 Tax=Pontibacter liquoris TaxID=2905677 RepID=UPI001FA77E99|nr:twin-arginine translocase TatA/TatE family subunit [Pontibacter liquoris]